MKWNDHFWQVDLEPKMWYKEWVQRDVRTKCAHLYVLVWEGVLFTLPVGSLGIESCRQAKNNNPNKRKCCRNHLMQQVLLCLWFRPLKFFTVQSRLKIANTPNFVSTSIHCSAATAKMRTNLLKDNVSIQFEGEPFGRTPRVHQVVVENFAFFVVLDGLTYFLVGYTQHVLRTVDDKRASLHEIRPLSCRALYSFVKNNFPVPLPSSPFFRCSFMGMVFHGNGVALSDFLFCRTFIRQWRSIVCICVPSFPNSFARTILWKIVFS